MKAKITKVLLKELKSENKESTVHDTELPGFMLRARKTGSMSYSVRYRTPDGQDTRLTIGNADKLTPQQARDHAKRLLADVTRGEDPAQKKRAARCQTLGDFIESYYEEYMTSQWKSGAGQVNRIRRGFKGFLKMRMSAINDKRVQDWRSKRLKKAEEAAKAGKPRKPGDATLNRDISALKACLARAAEQGFIQENPLSNMKLKREDSRGKIRYLKPEEEKRLIEALDAREERIRAARKSGNVFRRERNYDELPDLRKVAFADHLKPMILVSLNTGLRRGELLSLKWTDLELEDETPLLTVRGKEAKNSRTRVIPLNDKALDTLAGWQAQSEDAGGEYVFPGKDGKPLDNVKKSWTNLLEKAAIENFRWHDLRHSFASHLVQEGIELVHVRDLLGHADFSTTLRYAHVSPVNRSAAVAKLDARRARHEADNIVEFKQVTAE